MTYFSGYSQVGTKPKKSSNERASARKFVDSSSDEDEEVVAKPKKSSNAAIDSDSDGEEKEPEKGPDSDGDGGLDEKASARQIVASSSGMNCIKIGLPGKLILSKRKALREVIFS